MTYGKCVWNGCTRHAVKASTGACRAHHALMRQIRCTKCAGPLETPQEIEQRLCRHCTVARVA